MIGNDWDEKLQIIWNSSGFKNFYKNIMNEYEVKTIYPLKDNIFNALKLIKASLQSFKSSEAT